MAFPLPQSMDLAALDEIERLARAAAASTAASQDEVSIDLEVWPDGAGVMFEMACDRLSRGALPAQCELIAAMTPAAVLSLIALARQASTARQSRPLERLLPGPDA